MREPETGVSHTTAGRYTTPIKLLPTAGTAALRPPTRTLGHRRLNIHASQSCTENAHTCRVCSDLPAWAGWDNHGSRSDQ